MYMSEVSPKDMRGRALSMQQFAIVFGQIVIFYVNFKIASLASEAPAGGNGLALDVRLGRDPRILFCIPVFVIPESPRWNVMMGRDDQALAMLTKVSNAAHAQNLLKEIKDSLHQDQQQQHRKLNYGDVRVRFILFVGCMIAMLQQVTGVNVMMYYAPVVLKTVTEKRAGSAVPDHLDRRAAAGRFGHRRHADGSHGSHSLMRYGTLGAIAGLLLTSYALYTRATGYFALFGMLFFMVFYALSRGVGAQVLVSEIFPNRMRAQGMATAVGCMWVANFAVSQSFQ